LSHIKSIMKIRYFSTLAIAAIASLSILSSCNINCKKGSGHSVTETRRVGDFTKIDISGGYRLNIKQDSSMDITVTADDNLMKYIQTTVSGGKLKIYSKKSLCNAGEMVVNVSVRTLEAISASGAVEVVSQGKIVTGNLNLDLSGATRVNLDLNAANVVTDGSGATEVRLKGQAASHKIELSGSGKLYAFDFVASDYRIETSGASHCEINVLKSLSVETSGASEIKYKGSPANISNHKSGASSIQQVQ
jgi:hypothetical protein